MHAGRPARTEDTTVTRILIAEDDEAVATMLEVTFELEGYETEIVTDGAEATARLAGDPADVLLLDVMMPKVDGLAILRELRALPAWEDTKVIVLTALASDDDLWAGWSAGADYYLTKPFDLGHLRDVVARMLADQPIT